VGLVSIPPPGTWLSHAALADILRSRSTRTFLDVGCGSGHYSKLLCNMGLSGVGIDFGADAITATTELLSEEIHSRKFHTILADMASMPKLNQEFDLVISMMVLEHIEGDSDFVRKLVDHLAVGGALVIAVPGRKEKWTFEDEVVGHVRRYERRELEKLLSGVGIQNVGVWSVGVPTINMLARVRVRMVKSRWRRSPPHRVLVNRRRSLGFNKYPLRLYFRKYFD